MLQQTTEQNQNACVWVQIQQVPQWYNIRYKKRPQKSNKM